MDLDGTDSDIECVFVSEKINVKTVTNEVFIVSDITISDESAELDITSKSLPAPSFPVDERPTTPVQTPGEDGQREREEWELLFDSGRKSVGNLPEVEESFADLNPLNVAVCFSDDANLTITSLNNSGSKGGLVSGRESNCSDVICDDPPLALNGSSSPVEVAVPKLSSDSIRSSARNSKRRSDCLLTPQTPSESQTKNQSNFSEKKTEENVVCRKSTKNVVKKKKTPSPVNVTSFSEPFLNLQNDKDEKKLEKEAKKREKEEFLEKKRLEKEEKNKQRKAVKLQKESEKLQKQAFKEAYRPLQGGKKSLDHLTAHVPRAMLDAMGRVEVEEVIAEESGVINVVEVDAPLGDRGERGDRGDRGEGANVIRWTRSHVTASLDSNEQFNKLSTFREEIEEKDILIQIPKKSLVSMIEFHKQLQNGKAAADRDSLQSFHQRWRTKHPNKVLHFFAYGMENYFKNQLNNAVYGDGPRPAKSKPARRSILDIPYDVTHDDMEEAFIDFACRTNRRIILVDTPRDFARLFVTIHKAIADATFKNMKQQETYLFDAISANTKTNGVFIADEDPAVGSSGSSGYKELWVRQLEQFALVSRDVAVTLVNLYPSPRLLLQAYEECLTEEEKEGLVENVILRRGTERRVGPKMSRLLYCFMSSFNGDELLE